MPANFTKAVSKRGRIVFIASQIIVCTDYVVIQSVILYYSLKKTPCFNLFSVQIHTFWMAEDKIGLTHVLYLHNQS